MKLKYLFKVEFVDGTSITQTHDDVSSIDPKRNTYYDVLQSKKAIRSFTLRRFLERYSVNLLTGTFSINGVEVVPEPIVDTKTGEAVVVTKRELVWYMNVKKHFNASYKRSGEVTGVQPTSEEREYFFGWSTQVNKKTYTRVIGIK